MTVEGPPHSVDGGDVVPEVLPARPPAPVKSRNVGLLAGMLGLWALPRSTGPHLGSSRWRTAVLAGLVGAFGSAWLLSSATVSAEYAREKMTFKQRVYLGPQVVLMESMRAMTDRQAFFLFGLALPGALVVGVLGAALLAAPFADVGEPFNGLMARCVRASCWFTSVGMPIGMLFIILEHFDVFHDRGNQPFYQRGIAYELVELPVAIWAARVWLRMLWRYGGPANGPVWEPIHPLCRDCGYRITGLSADGLCPECGLPVAESPHVTPPSIAWQRASNPLTRLLAFFPTVFGVCFARRFFQRVGTLTYHNEARRFFLYNWTLLSLAALGLTLLVDQALAAGRHSGMIRAAETIVVAGCGLALMVCVAQALLITMVWIQQGRRARAGTTRFYLIALLWPVMVAVHGLVLAALIAVRLWGPMELFIISGRRVRGGDAIWVATIAAVVLLLGWMVRRADRAHRAARYANA